MRFLKTNGLALFLLSLTITGGYAKKSQGAAGFDVVKGAKVKKAKSGYVLEAKEVGYAMKKTSKAYKNKVTFELSFKAVPKGGTRNAFLVFGDSSDDKKTIKCGSWIGGGKYAIFQGPKKFSGLDAKFDKSKALKAKVTVDLKKKTVEMLINGKKLKQKIKGIDKITYYGLWINSTTSTFSEVKIQGQ